MTKYGQCIRFKAVSYTHLLLGGRDHSTIIHGIKKIADEYESNENTRNLIETIKKKINPN